jgi:hypothetical protein
VHVGSTAKQAQQALVGGTGMAFSPFLADMMYGVLGATPTTLSFCLAKEAQIKAFRVFLACYYASTDQEPLIMLPAEL